MKSNLAPVVYRLHHKSSVFLHLTLAKSLWLCRSIYPEYLNLVSHSLLYISYAPLFFKRHSHRTISGRHYQSSCQSTSSLNSTNKLSNWTMAPRDLPILRLPRILLHRYISFSAWQYCRSRHHRHFCRQGVSHARNTQDRST